MMMKIIRRYKNMQNFDSMHLDQIKFKTSNLIQTSKFILNNVYLVNYIHWLRTYTEGKVYASSIVASNTPTHQGIKEVNNRK